MNRLKSERVGAGLTQYELADRIDVSPTTIANWEKGTAQIPAGKLIELKHVFGCTSDFLLGESESRTQDAVAN